jgi:hypothetical protein
MNQAKKNSTVFSGERRLLKTKGVIEIYLVDGDIMNLF